MTIDTIIIADDHPVFREGLSRIVRRVLPGVILEAAEISTLFDHLQDTPNPSLLILDLVFPGFDGASSVKHLRQKCPQSAIIVVSMNDAPKTAKDMLAAGANGYISKSVLPEQMQSAIADVLAGDVVLLLEARPKNKSNQASLIQGLSPRHVDLLVRLGQGKSNKEIARELDISPFTVRAHMSALFKKLDVSSRASAAAIAALNGLV